MFLAADAKEITMSFEIDNPQVEVGLLGTQDKYVALIEEGMNVQVNPFGTRRCPFDHGCFAEFSRSVNARHYDQ